MLVPVRRMRARRRWTRVAPLVRLLAGVAVLGLIVRQLGTGPFRTGAAALTPAAVGVTAAVTALATACAAWRWRTVARLLGVAIGRSQAVGAYYRSQLLNSVLPGGVLGDVHRTLRLGRTRTRPDDTATVGVGLAARAVVWERVAGQAVQAVVTVAVLLLAPSRLRPHLGAPAVALATALVALAVGVAATVLARRWGAGTLAHLVLASLLVVAAHAAVFVVGARLVAPEAPAGDLVALTMLVLTASAVPLSIGGWGVREGAAAWAFGAAGLGASTGVEATTVYGLMALTALAPGGALLVRDAVSRG